MMATETFPRTIKHVRAIDDLVTAIDASFERERFGNIDNIP